ncbi:MAG TPA: hypothetical protein VMZ24_04305 [Patescibacteria group bacterium]|nr:hypothetical protein [Patescibacteria group bacterium]
MSNTIILHISNEEAIIAEIEKLPDTRDMIVIVNNPRRRDGKDLHYLEDEVISMIIPWHRINFIEVLPSSGELDEVITIVRDE